MGKLSPGKFISVQIKILHPLLVFIQALYINHTFQRLQCFELTFFKIILIFLMPFGFKFFQLLS